MKKITMFLMISVGAFTLNAQSVKFSTEASISTEITNIKGAESTSDDAFTVFAHIECSDERQKEIWDAFNHAEVKIQINGIEIIAEGFNEISILYSFQKDDGEEYLFLPSIEAEIPLQGLMQIISDKIKEAGNVLSVEFVFDGASLGKGELIFDVPEFGDAEGDFCGFRGKNYLQGEEGLIALATGKFKSENSGKEFVFCFLPVSWMESEDENGKEMYTSVWIIYKEDGIYKSMGYTAHKPFKNGAYSTEIIFELDTYIEQVNIHPLCVESLMK